MSSGDIRIALVLFPNEAGDFIQDDLLRFFVQPHPRKEGVCPLPIAGDCDVLGDHAHLPENEAAVDIEPFRVVDALRHGVRAQIHDRIRDAAVQLVNTMKRWIGAGESPFGSDARFLIRDRNRRYTAEVDWYFMEMGMLPKVISPGAPVMNYHAEQFVRKIKHECLSHCLFLSGAALRKVIDAYVDYYNTQRPNTRFHGGGILEDRTHWQTGGEVKQVSQLPGLLNYYYREPPK